MPFELHESHLKWRPTDGLPDTLPRRKQKENCKQEQFSSLEPGVIFAECNAVYFNSILELRHHSGWVCMNSGDIISSWHGCVYTTQFHLYSWYSLYITIFSLTDFKVSNVTRKKKKLVKMEQKNNSRCILENTLSKPIRLLTLVMIHCLHDLWPGSSLLPRRPIFH